MPSKIAKKSPKARPKRYIEILDTTLRDGEQMKGISFSPEEKLNISKLLLEKVGVDRVEVTSARSSRGELEAAKKVISWAKGAGFGDKIEILGFVDGELSVEWVNKAGGKVINLLCKGSLRHLKYQLKKTPKQHVRDISVVAKNAKAREMDVNVYLEDWSNGMIHSPNYVFDIIGALEKLGVKRIMLADTLGILSPTEVEKYVREVTRKFRKMHFDFHAHNDYGLSTANCLAAAKAGINGLHATVNGLGERAGNTHLSELAASLSDLGDFRTGINESELYNTSKLVERFSGVRIPMNRPIIGENAFTQTAGVHADGDSKGGLYISKLTPERFGREREYALGKLSGKASLEQNLKKLGLDLTKEQRDQVLRRIVDLSEKKNFVSPTDLSFIIADTIGEPKKKTVEITKVMVPSGLNLVPTASIALVFKGEEYTESATGNGGYDAFMNATSKILEGELGLKLPKLEDYEVIIPPGGKTDALVETKITWSHKGKVFCTVGVDSDQIMAAIKATEKMLNIVF